uniref:Uncharacterized protein n=1 Tax=Picea glauca TaxID=3330 RepID=A0A101M4S7_PICGL|nr:hypothetical protein ABT39_MTgene728 [Picea glauca]
MGMDLEMLLLTQLLALDLYLVRKSYRDLPKWHGSNQTIYLSFKTVYQYMQFWNPRVPC